MDLAVCLPVFLVVLLYVFPIALSLHVFMKWFMHLSKKKTQVFCVVENNALSFYKFLCLHLSNPMCPVTSNDV